MSSTDTSGSKTTTTDSKESKEKTDSKTTTTDSKTTTDSNKYAADNHLDKTTLILTASFLAIYFVIYAITGLFYDSSDVSQVSAKATMVDIAMVIIIVFAGWVYYYSLPPSSQDTYWTDMGTAVKNYLNNAYSIMHVVLFIVLSYLGIFIMGVPMTPEGKPWVIDFLESKAYILLFILCFIQFFKYVLGIDIIAVIFGDAPLPVLAPISEETKPKETKPKETKKVFNISNNLYTYEDAKAVCKAMGSELANYDQVEEAYLAGAEWASYGWSEGQHAYFPTQKDTWNKLQKVKGHEHDLGRPGVNGGYFANPNVRFGVNCYGVKPPSTDQEKALMSARKDRVYPKSAEDKASMPRWNFGRRTAIRCWLSMGSIQTSGRDSNPGP